MTHRLGRSNDLIVRGLLAVIAGVGTWYLHPTSLIGASILWGSYSVLIGLAAGLVAFFLARKNHEWKIPAVVSFMGVIGAIALYVFARIGLAVFSGIVGIWAILMGIFDFAEAIRARGLARSALGWIGFLSIAFGVVIFKHPFAGR